MTAASCDTVRELLDAAALDALDEPDASVVARHVEHCDACQQELTRARGAAAALGLSVPLLRLSPEARSRLFDRLDAPASGPRRSWRWPLVAAASVALALGLGGWALALQIQVNDLRAERREAPREAALVAMLDMALEPDLAEISLAGVQEGEEARGRYVWRRDGRGLLVGDALPPIDEDEVFALWFVQGGQPRLAGTFHAYERGRGWLLVEDPPGPWEELRVSIEPEDAVSGSGRLVLASSR